MVLGVAEEFLKNLENFVIKTNQNVSVVAWYCGVSGSFARTMSPKAFSNLSNSISSIVTVSSGAFSTSTSTGGGFSGGGGGSGAG